MIISRIKQKGVLQVMDRYSKIDKPTRTLNVQKENGKFVVWTTRRFISSRFPFNDEGDNYTFFYISIKATEFLTCLSRLTEQEKLLAVSEKLGIPTKEIVFKTKKSHFKTK